MGSGRRAAPFGEMQISGFDLAPAQALQGGDLLDPGLPRSNSRSMRSKTDHRQIRDPAGFAP
jgi:hypothetical protein